jgi:hypothetical protein
MNFIRAFMDNLGKARAVGVIRYSIGLVLAIYTTFISIDNNNQEKMEGLIGGIKLCMSLGFKKVFFQGDLK